MSALTFLKKKYPVLEYFNNIEGINEDSLNTLANEIHMEPKSMSPQCKQIMKKIRQFARYAESKLKKSRKLYKFLISQQDYLTQIIMNNEKLKSLQALENRQFEHLTQLQFSNNEIEHLDPLLTLQVPSLQQIDLSSNAISFLNTINSCRWMHLSTLLLSQNKIVSVQNISFSNFQNLKIVNLSDNFLTSVKYLRKEFNGNLKSLKKLDFSNNFIMDIHYLSECKFILLNYLNLQNNSYPHFFEVQKYCMTFKEKSMQHSLSHYEIRVSTDWTRDKLFIYRYREMSKHKLSVKIEVAKERVKRETIQKGRRLIFD